MMNAYQKNPSSLLLLMAMIIAMLFSTGTQVHAIGDLPVDDDFLTPFVEETDALFNSTLHNETGFFSNDTMAKTITTDVADNNEDGNAISGTSSPTEFNMVESLAFSSTLGTEITLGFSALALVLLAA